MDIIASATPKSSIGVLSFLVGGGEMGARIRAFDWASTSLGPAESWPQSLKTAVRIMLTSRQPIWIGWGPDLLFLYNDPYKAIIGGKHPQSLGRPTNVVWHEIWNDIGPMLSQAMTGVEGTYFESHLLIMERNGYPEETYYTFSYSPIPDDEGNAGGIICANTDDTRRVISERQLALLRDLSACTADARTSDEACRRGAMALATDPEDIPFAMIYLATGSETTAALKGICGIEPGHPAAPEFLVNGESSWPSPDLRDADHVIELSQHFDAAFPAGPWAKAPARAAVLTLPAAGEFGCQGLLVVGLNPYRLYDDNYGSFLRLVAGQITAAIANAEAYQNERRKAEALIEIDRAKTAFFSNISHEFRTPLTLMLGPLEEKLATAANLPGEEIKWIRMVHRNGLRLLRLVNTLLDFARLEAGRAQATFRPIDLSAMTAELASNFRAATDKAGLTLTVDCPPLAEPVYVDSESWEKIVLNLLSNAFKFTLQGQITVSLRLVDRTAELAVRDTGIGIPAAEIPRLFERFHRVANAGGRSHEGSGIGLSLVQELTKLHGGAVRVESGSGRGSCFYVSIPLGTAHLPAELVKRRPASPPRPMRADAFLEEALRWLPSAVSGESGLDAELTRSAETEDRPRVVLADDNADMRDYVRRLLADRYVVDMAVDGEEALATIRARRPDLVLTDVMMPRLDGLGLLQVIRGDPGLRDLPVILLSARAGGDAEVQGRTAGADDYLTKPFSARELVARIGAALELAGVRRQAAAAIRESETRLRALVNATSQAIYRMSPDWSEMREVDGHNILTDSQVVKTDWLKDVVHPDDYSSVWNDIQEAIRTKSVFDREHRVRRADGSWGWIHVRAVPLLDANGKIYEWFGAAADVSARRTAQEELTALNADLERRVDLAASQLVQLQKMESIGQLTGGIAHDFNNLLMAILTSLDIAKARLPGGDPRLLMVIDNAVQAAQRGAALTHRMLAFARKQELKPEPVSLPELVFGMADLLSRSIGPQIRIETRHAFGTMKALVDCNQLEMAILNLAVNARDAMPDGGILVISSDEVSIFSGGPVAPGQYARLKVIDSGTGMDAETLRRATEPFFTTKGTGKGTGLGLSMVHGLAAQSGGHFSLHSASGQGTTAEILLPVSNVSKGAVIPAAVGERLPGRSAPRQLALLAVDDDPLVLTGMVMVLEEQGHRVIEACSGREALELLEKGAAVDVVITDQAMPGMTGAQLMAAIQSRWPHVPVILATGYGESPEGCRPIRRLRKPFSPDELANALAEAVGPTSRVAALRG